MPNKAGRGSGFLNETVFQLRKDSLSVTAAIQALCWSACALWNPPYRRWCLFKCIVVSQSYDVTPPDVSRIAVYDRNMSTYEQTPRVIGVTHSGGVHSIPGGVLTVNSSRVSLALVAADRITNVPNSNGIFEAVWCMWMMNPWVVSDWWVDYLQTRYLNAHIDYRIKSNGGSFFQHLSPLPGDRLPIYYKKTMGWFTSMTPPHMKWKLWWRMQIIIQRWFVLLSNVQQLWHRWRICRKTRYMLP